MKAGVRPIGAISGFLVHDPPRLFQRNGRQHRGDIAAQHTSDDTIGFVSE